MIVPYYNCLLLGHKYNELELDEQGQEMIKDYLQEHLSSHSIYTISITCLGHKNMQVIGRLKNILHMLITNLAISVYEINDTYTLSQEIHMKYEALKELNVRDGQSHKAPAIIQNMNLMKKYYTTYRSEGQMKDFLKSLLIQEINHEKRCIKYRQANLIASLINKELSNMKGDIFISQTSSENHSADDITIVLINQKAKETSKLQLLIREIEDKIKINKNANTQITQQYTLQYLRKNAVAKFNGLIQRYYHFHISKYTENFVELKDNFILINNLRATLRYGLHLSEQQVKLKEQFLAFITQMRVKYTNQISKYFQSVKVFQNYQRQRSLHTQKNNKRSMICKYLKGFSQVMYYKQSHKIKIQKQCKIIQSRITGYLINQRLYHSINKAYLLEKQNINNKYKEFYNKITALQNQNQIKRLAKFNRYKYGFSCCIFIIDLINKANCEQFQPSNILRFFERVTRNQDICTKIRCGQSSMEVHTIQGKIYRLGDDESIQSTHITQKQPFCIYDSNKENIPANTSRSYQSIIHQFDSQSKNSSNGMKKNSSRNLSNSSSLKSSTKQIKGVIQVKQNCQRFVGKNYEFKLEESGKLYGKGKNSLGQLGVENLEVNEYTLILPFQKVKLVATSDNLTVIMTATNKLFHFGRQRGRLPQTKIPLQFHLREKFISKQIVITSNDIYFLTKNNKVYSFQLQKTIRIPKEMQLSFENFHIIKTGGVNMEIIYVIGFWVNSLDPIKKNQIQKYLTGLQSKAKSSNCESILVQEGQHDLKSIHQLSAILEESSF